MNLHSCDPILMMLIVIVVFFFLMYTNTLFIRFMDICHTLFLTQFATAENSMYLICQIFLLDAPPVTKPKALVPSPGIKHLFNCVNLHRDYRTSNPESKKFHP